MYKTHIRVRGWFYLFFCYICTLLYPYTYLGKVWRLHTIITYMTMEDVNLLRVYFA